MAQKKPTKVQLKVRIEQAARAKLEKLCQESGMTLSKQVERLILAASMLFTLLLSAACGSPYHERVELPAYLDTSTLDAKHVARVEAAAAEWYMATDGGVDLLVGDGDRVPVTMADLSQMNDAGVTIHHNDRIEIELDDTHATGDPVRLRGIVMHEIGHALGLPHAADGIMYKWSQDKPTCIDADALRLVCEVYRCGPNARSTCDAIGVQP